MVVLPLANVGTPLMWFGFTYPLVGTVGVTLLEDWLLRRWFRPGLGMHLVYGNVLSTLVGIGLLTLAYRKEGFVFGPRPLEGLHQATALAWISAYVLSVAIELPFVARRLRVCAVSGKALLATSGVNLVSYLLMFGVFALHSSSSIGVSVRVAPAEVISEPDGWVYYVATDGRTVRRVRLDGSNDAPTPYLVGGRTSGLVIAPINEKTAALFSDEPKGEKTLDRSLGTARQAAIPPYLSVPPYDTPLRASYGRGYTFGSSFLTWDGRGRNGARFSCFNEVWPEFGLRLRSPGGSFSIGVSSPIAGWVWSGTTVLEDGRVVGQWGPQIALIDIPSKRVAWLANGSGPAVLMDRPVRP